MTDRQSLPRNYVQLRSRELAREAGIGWARKPYCKHGHDFITPGTYELASDGRRICLACRRGT